MTDLIENGFRVWYTADVVKKIFFGGLLVFGSFSIVTLIYLLGYLGKVMRMAYESEDDDVLPKFSKTIAVIKEGVVFFGLLLCSSGLIFGSGIVTLSGIGLFFVDLNSVSTVLVLRASNMVFGISLLVFFFFFPLLCIQYIVTGSFVRTFNVNLLLEWLSSWKIWYAYLLSVIQSGIFIFGTLLLVRSISIFVLILVPFMLFFHLVVVFRWYGLAAS